MPALRENAVTKVATNVNRMSFAARLFRRGCRLRSRG